MDHLFKKLGQVNGLEIYGKKSSSLASVSAPYIPFICSSAKASSNFYKILASFYFPAGLITPKKNLGGIPNLKTPSIYVLITLR